MFDFLKQKGTQVKESGSAKVDSTRFDSTQLAEGSKSEVVGSVLQDVLRMNGIPVKWVTCEIRQIALSQSRNEVQIQMIIMRWSEQLLRYSAALQKQFLESLDHFEPHVDHSDYVVVWRFADSCDSPFPSIPDSVKWHISALNAS
jgi:hypothetical protein